MAESSEDKTEAPTPRRRTEAREQGNIARSGDLTSALLLLGSMLSLRWFGANLLGAMRSVVAEMIGPASLSNLGSARLDEQTIYCIYVVAWAAAPLLGTLVFIVVFANVAQVGFYLNIARLTPNLAALNPVRGLSKLFGAGQGIVNLLMNLLKVIIVSLVAYSAVHNRLGEIVGVQQLVFTQIFALACDIVFSIGMRVGIVLLILAIIDYLIQRWRIERSLRMSKQEVKDEMRQMDGDPRMKQRRRQIAVQRHMQRLKKEVPTADVVVTNPTHFAVALKYEEKSMRAPRLIAKGADFMAMRIRELAVEAGVPIVERPPLARAIYKMVDVGEELPEQFYSAVAEILAYVYELNRKVKRTVTA